MKTKTGFTLAEVLIALTIIGIIAAIIVPHLTKNLQKRQTGVTLARATQQIETGIQEYFQYKSKTNNKYRIHYSNFSDINDNIKIAEFSSFLGLTKSDVDTVNYREYAFTPITLLPSAYAANEAAKPSTYSHKGLRYSMTFDDNKLDFSETEDNSIVIGFLIDTNGHKNNPNMYGKDVFRYGITNSGKLVPEGQSEQTCADGNITNGLSCTARIVKDGYKIRYY